MPNECDFAISVAVNEPTGIGKGEPPALPRGFELFQNYPNPFNPTTTISFTLADFAPALLNVYDARGCLVATLINRPLHPGRHEIVWQADSQNSGVYFYQLQKGPVTVRKKMILAK